MKKLFTSKICVGLVVAVLFFAVATIYGCTSCSYTPDDNSSGAAIENSEVSEAENSIIDTSDVSMDTENSEPSEDISDNSSEHESSDVSETEESKVEESDVSSDVSSGETSDAENSSVETSDDVSDTDTSEDVSKEEKPPVENSDVSNPENSETSKENPPADTSTDVSAPENNDSDFVFTLNMNGGSSQNKPYMMEDSVVTITGTAFDKTCGIKSVKVSGGNSDSTARITEDGTFDIRFSVKQPNIIYTLTFTATNNAGETISIVRYVSYKRLDPPMVDFMEGASEDNPKYITVAPGSTTVSYTFEGYVSQMYGFNVKSVTINGVTAKLASKSTGAWDWSVTLADLPVNTAVKLTVVAKNNVGKTATVERYVYFDSPSLTEKTVFAVYSADDNSLTFYNRLFTASVGEKFNGKTVTAIYTGFDTTSYSSASETPWHSVRKDVNSIKIECEFAPLSTAYWFHGFTKCASIDLRNLDTQNVKDMTNMFYMTGRYADNLSITGLEYWDTSNVTSMENMFCLAGQKASFSLDLSDWDVSNVTSYSDFNKKAEDKIIAPNFK